MGVGLRSRPTSRWPTRWSTSERFLRSSMAPGLLRAVRLQRRAAPGRAPPLRGRLGVPAPRRCEAPDGPPAESGERLSAVFVADGDDAWAAVAAWRIVADALGLVRTGGSSRDRARVAPVTRVLHEHRSATGARAIRGPGAPPDAPVELGVLGELDPDRRRAATGWSVPHGRPATDRLARPRPRGAARPGTGPTAATRGVGAGEPVPLLRHRPRLRRRRPRSRPARSRPTLRGRRRGSARVGRTSSTSTGARRSPTGRAAWPSGSASAPSTAPSPTRRSAGSRSACIAAVEQPPRGRSALSDSPTGRRADRSRAVARMLHNNADMCIYLQMSSCPQGRGRRGLRLRRGRAAPALCRPPGPRGGGGDGGHPTSGESVADHTRSLAAAYPSLVYAPTDTDAPGRPGPRLLRPAPRGVATPGARAGGTGRCGGRPGGRLPPARSRACIRTWYGAEHSAPELLDTFVYGLPELQRAELAGATRIAAPGCYPTAALLALAPLVEAGVAEPARRARTRAAPLLVDAASGVSGAGRAPTETLHFGTVDEDFVAYGLLDHRHTPEIEQGLGTAVLFTPHLAPMVRGILATCYARPADRPRAHHDGRARAPAHAGTPASPSCWWRSSPPSTKSASGSNTRPPHRAGRSAHRLGGGPRRHRQPGQGRVGAGGAVREPRARSPRDDRAPDRRGSTREHHHPRRVRGRRAGRGDQELGDARPRPARHRGRPAGADRGHLHLQPGRSRAGPGQPLPPGGERRSGRRGRGQQRQRQRGHRRARSGRRRDDVRSSPPRVSASQPRRSWCARPGSSAFPCPWARSRRRSRRLVAARASGPEAGSDAALGILTTDSGRKEVLVEYPTFTVAGMAKGAGMLAPDMATMLAFLTTDAAVDPGPLAGLLRSAVDDSFNSMSIDGCTSTNDTVILMASGRAGPVDPDHGGRRGDRGLRRRWPPRWPPTPRGPPRSSRCRSPGRGRDGEAHRAARKVADSLLVKCSINGADPYWGRVASELGSAGRRHSRWTG